MRCILEITDRPEYLVFTAPYRLCEGGCPKDRNFVLSFPLYVGTRGRAAYQSTYHRDATKVHSNRPNAPFRKRTTRAPTTPCPTERPTTEEKEDPALIQLLYKEKECKNYTGLCLQKQKKKTTRGFQFHHKHHNHHFKYHHTF